MKNLTVINIEQMKNASKDSLVDILDRAQNELHDKQQELINLKWSIPVVENQILSLKKSIVEIKKVYESKK